VARQPRRKTKNRYPRCNTCKYAITWFSLRGDWRAFDPKVHAPGERLMAAYPVEGKRASPVGDLIEEFMGRYEIDRTDAEEHVYALPWHVLHACPPDLRRAKEQINQ
jgi:hypothetical protein